jgi:hypothetical protein
MMYREEGTIYFALTKTKHCNHCNNNTPMFICEDYVKQSFILIPIPTTYLCPYLKCPVCEKRTEIDESGWFFRSKEYDLNVIRLIEEGKDETKIWFQKMDRNNKDKALGRLNAAKAYSVVRYILS